MRSEKSATRTQETGVQNGTKLHYITDSSLNADIHWGIMLGCSTGEGSRKCREEVHKSGLNYKWKYFLKGSSKRQKKEKKFIKSELKMTRSAAAARELDILVEVSGSPQ